MTGYGPHSYGEAFADVYDDWYGDLPGTEAAVAGLARLAGPGPVLELGVGTGRLAIPLAARGLAVTGIDASPAMLARLRVKAAGDRVRPIEADMGDFALAGRFALVFVALNTIFNLVTAAAQQQCIACAAAHLTPGGRFVVEAAVVAADMPAGEVHSPAAVRSVTPVETVTVAGPEPGTVHGRHVERSGADDRVRPWQLRVAGPAELDAMARRAGLRLASRWGGWAEEPFDATSPMHISVYEGR
jgi:SAM-dependent methyltransferase